MTVKEAYNTAERKVVFIKQKRKRKERDRKLFADQIIEHIYERREPLL